MSRRSLALDYLEALLIAVIFATFARTWVVQAFKIPTGSMEQNLLVGDHILVNKFIYGAHPGRLESALLPVHEVRRGDVVVFKYPRDPSRDFIKRCVGLPGDRVEIIDKHLWVNDLEVDDIGYTFHEDERTYPRSLFLHENFRKRDNFGPYEVPANHLFCLGDNRDNSNDSRFWGPVPMDHIRGRALMVYWSFDTGGREDLNWRGYGHRLRQLTEVGLEFIPRTRWERTFRLIR